MYRFIAVLLMSGLGLPLLAQEAGPAEIQEKLVDHWKTSKKYMLALANQMPDADYGFKPNKDEMSFGEQLAHIAGSNGFFFATLAGKKDPIGKPANFDKATVIKLLNDSYDFAIATLQDLDFSRFHETFDVGEEGKMSGLELYLFAVDHTAHHRGQCIVYLRAKNIKPVDYQF
jgi:uncharacterized damage-inducible protein DinB